MVWRFRTASGHWGASTTRPKWREERRTIPCRSEVGQVHAGLDDQRRRDGRYQQVGEEEEELRHRPIPRSFTQSIGSLACFLELHLAHEIRRLVRTWAPPRARGMKWSMW